VREVGHESDDVVVAEGHRTVQGDIGVEHALDSERGDILGNGAFVKHVVLVPAVAERSLVGGGDGANSDCHVAM
jgi:hypothetical protein